MYQISELKRLLVKGVGDRDPMASNFVVRNDRVLVVQPDSC